MLDWRTSQTGLGWHGPMATALPGEAAVGPGFVALIREPDEFAALHPGFVSAVEFGHELMRQALPDFGVIGRGRQVAALTRIGLQVKKVGAIANRVIRVALAPSLHSP